ncbi:uncharacterized protein LOC141620530 [Silene latifolia]|uniref:uncharacterized protein LOC141620530 n=1 Tax=Silene latifolia TaxID=37657 RepID=UPI003D7890E1
MASSQMNKASYHTRSISLPSTSHPITAQFDQQLTKLRSSQAASTSSSLSLSQRLTGLTELYVFVDEMLQLPSNQQSLSRIQAVLDGSVNLIDACSTSRDVLQQSKQRLQHIQSVLRRRISGELNITKEVAEYVKARKTIKKVVKKCLKNIKSDNPNASEFFMNDVQEITVDMFKSLLSYISGTKSQSKKSWSLVTKLINKSSEKEESAAQTSEFDVVDATLESIVCQKKTRVNIDGIRNQMVNLESEIEQLDEILECLFRHLVKTRSTLLNILSN